MGLDISLYTKSQREYDERYDAAWEEVYERMGGDDHSYEDRQAEIARVLGDGAEKTTPEEVDTASREYGSDTLCNRRYLRSSYNEGGFNSYVPKMLGDDEATFYGIFQWMPWRRSEEEREKYGNEPGGWLDADSIPALTDAATTAREIGERLRAMDDLAVMSESSLFREPDPTLTNTRALQLTREKLEQNAGVFGDSGFSFREGSVFPKGIEVVGFYLGVETNFRGGFVPATHVVYRAPGLKDSYVESARICAEFCEEAIDLVRRDGSCYVSWSG